MTPNPQVLHTLLDGARDERKESKKCLPSPPSPSFFFSNNSPTWICSKIFVEFHVFVGGLDLKCKLQKWRKLIRGYYAEEVVHSSGT
jgi:hypothetical protein